MFVVEDKGKNLVVGDAARYVLYADPPVFGPRDINDVHHMGQLDGFGYRRYQCAGLVVLFVG